MADCEAFVHCRDGPRPSPVRSFTAPAALSASAVPFQPFITTSFTSHSEILPTALSATAEWFRPSIRSSFTSHSGKSAPSSARRTSRCSLLSAPEAGDILMLPGSIDPESIFSKHKTLNYYGARPEGHPIVVIEVHDDLIVGLPCTSFSGSSFADKCHSPAWADRYMPIGHDNHPRPDYRSLRLQWGRFGRPTYANVETPMVVEWSLCEPYRPSPRGGAGLALDSASLSALISTTGAWDRPAGKVQDPWKIRGWIKTYLPTSSLSGGGGSRRAISLPPVRTRLLDDKQAPSCTTTTTTTTPPSSAPTTPRLSYAAVASL